MKEQKKEVRGGINKLFSGDKEETTHIPQKTSTTIKESGKAKAPEKAPAKSATKDYAKGDRISIIVGVELHEKLHEMAYWGRSTIKDIAIEALTKAVKDYEKKHGILDPIPSDKVRKHLAYDK